MGPSHTTEASMNNENQIPTKKEVNITLHVFTGSKRLNNVSKITVIIIIATTGQSNLT